MTYTLDSLHPDLPAATTAALYWAPSISPEKTRKRW